MANVNDLTENLTLDEIKFRDEDNLKLLLQSARPVKFESEDQCRFWIGETLRKILAKMGCSLAYPYPVGNNKAQKKAEEKAAARLERQMKEKGVKVEFRTYGDADTIRMTLAAANKMEEDGDNDTARHLRTQAEQMTKESFKSGWYIYYENEIAYFISQPMHAQKSSGHLMLPGKEDKELFVMTNWKESITVNLN